LTYVTAIFAGTKILHNTVVFAQTIAQTGGVSSLKKYGEQEIEHTKIHKALNINYIVIICTIPIVFFNLINFVTSNIYVLRL